MAIQVLLSYKLDNTFKKHWKSLAATLHFTVGKVSPTKIPHFPLYPSHQYELHWQESFHGAYDLNQGKPERLDPTEHKRRNKAKE